MDHCYIGARALLINHINAIFHALTSVSVVGYLDPPQVDFLLGECVVDFGICLMLSGYWFFSARTSAA